MASTSQGVQTAMGIFGSLSLVGTIVGGGAPAAPIIAMIRLFKLFFRMRLVNTNFGEILEFFMS